jgi:WD40 repeat protein/energy-coupling factor transporter ATP-binding protein EcfA2
MPDTSPSDPDAVSQSVTSLSGSVDLDARRDVIIGGDVVGRDKIIGYTSEQVSALLTQISATFRPKPFDGRCPYLGLDAFSEEDADRFFGRETLVSELVARVKESRCVVTAGPSGSGKSSLVRAGLIHALKQGALPNSERWLYATLTPGRDPIESLALAMSRMAKSPEAGKYLREHFAGPGALHEFVESQLSDRQDQRAVIFVDQFEEVFTQVSKEDERLAFLNLLTHAATIENGRVTVLFALRSDFVSNCATYPQLNALLNQQFMQVGAMQPDELVSAIARPALQVGLRIDPDLIAQIVDDMQDEPGALPLMQFALKDLFDAQQAKGGVILLTLNDYLARGGLRKALERHADAAFAKLSENEQQLARAIFSGLIEIGRETQDTRRTAAFDELIPANTDAAQVKEAIRKLADARLITTGEQDHSVTVTIAHEKLIEAWLWLRKLINENREAIALQNQIAEDAQEWDEHQRDGSYLYSGARLATARERLKAKKIVLSDLAEDYVQAGRRQQQRRQWSWGAGIISVIILLLLAIVVFAFQSNENAGLAQRNAQIASSAQAASTLAVANASTAQAASTMSASEANSRATAEAVALHQRDLAFVRQLGAQSIAYLHKQFDLAGLLSLETAQIADELNDSFDGRKSLLAFVNEYSRFVVFLQGHTGSVFSLAFSPDGKMLASGSADKTIILWDVASSQQLGEPLNGHSAGVTSVAFSPDGKMLASGSADKTIILWDVASGQQLGEPLSGPSAGVTSVAFSPDDKMLASGSADKSVTLWNVTSRQVVNTFADHDNGVVGVAFGLGGRILASGSVDGRIMLWEVSTLKHIGTLYGHAGAVYSIAISSDGKTLASGNIDNSIMLWDLASHLRLAAPLTSHTGPITGLAFSPDGKTMSSVSNDKSVILWDVASRLPLGTLTDSAEEFGNSVAFSPDNKTLASSGVENSVVLWDVDSESWKDRICNLIDRNLTQVEWQQYFEEIGRPYRKTCERWPAGK